MTSLKLHIEGMHCGACVARVKKALDSVPSVQTRDVQVGSAELVYDPAAVEEEAILAAVRKAGFQPSAGT